MTIIRLASELASRTQMTTEEVEATFLAAACAEASSLHQSDNLQLLDRFYGCFKR
ncbi:hypothetical protein [Phormidium pseudopriestleyi]|uniref:hypothetical protein n=1 Tax=Phormidium pseudopriestleyi TaxID=1759527 RepID=UPI001A8EC2E0|nr:hypothetical protein [Phormidium pseudopriestleyi]